MWSKIGIVLFVFAASLQAAGEENNTIGGYSFPIDGGRKVAPVVNIQGGMEVSVGYLTVSSVDQEGALNPSSDQQSANQLLKQIHQIYIQIYNKYSGGGGQVEPSKKGSCPQNTPVPTGCSQRRSPRWR